MLKWQMTLAPVGDAPDICKRETKLVEAGESFEDAAIRFLASRSGPEFESAFEGLAPHIKGLIEQVAVRILGSPTDAEDVRETVLFKLWRADRIQITDASHLKYWLVRVTKNASLDLIKDRKRHPEISSFEMPDSQGVKPIHDRLKADEPNPESRVLLAERREGVRTALASLPVIYREVLVLRELEELSIEEIASVIGCPEGTVKGRLFRARAEIKKRLAGLMMRTKPASVVS